jgi:hypothetical protein
MSTQSLFLQNKIAVIWDFDKTLIPGHMQKPLFARYNIDEQVFWDETNGYEAFFKARGLQLFSRDNYYLLHILTYVRAGRFKGLNNVLLRELGGELELYPGLPEFFHALKQQVAGHTSFKQHDIEVEHYIVSNGLRQMILGSPIGTLATEVWACEFVEELPQADYLSRPVRSILDSEIDREIQAVGYQIDNTSKTKAIFEINKGSRFNRIDVNDTISYELRRIPFQNMVYIADGKSDVPVFSILNQYGGRTFAVYDPGEREYFGEVNDLLKQGRVDCIGPADYSEGTLAWYWISDAVREIAEQIVQNRQATLDERVGRAPGYGAEAPRRTVEVLTQEHLLDELRQPIPETITSDQPEPVTTINQQQPLMHLPVSDEMATTVLEYPDGFLTAVAGISDRFSPITEDEKKQLLVLIRSRPAARSDLAPRRRKATDRFATTPQELEHYLAQIRGTQSAPSLATDQ